jgi:hypothetical protein
MCDDYMRKMEVVPRTAAATPFMFKRIFSRLHWISLRISGRWNGGWIGPWCGCLLPRMKVYPLMCEICLCLFFCGENPSGTKPVQTTTRRTRPKPYNERRKRGHTKHARGWWVPSNVRGAHARHGAYGLTVMKLVVSIPRDP